MEAYEAILFPQFGSVKNLFSLILFLSYALFRFQLICSTGQASCSHLHWPSMSVAYIFTFSILIERARQLRMSQPKLEPTRAECGTARQVSSLPRWMRRQRLRQRQLTQTRRIGSTKPVSGGKQETSSREAFIVDRQLENWNFLLA